VAPREGSASSGIAQRAGGIVTRRAAAILVAVLLVAGLLVGGCTGPAPPPAGSDLAWKRLAAAPSKRTEVTAAATGTRVYVAGGFDAGGATLATVEVYDTATGRWEPGPDLPVAVNHAMSATVAGTVYVFGGHLGGGGQSAAAYRLDGAAWRPLADLPEGRAAGTAVAVDGTVYLAGGVSGGRLADRMLVYDTAGDRWSTAPGPPTPREHLGGVGYGGLVYTVGGRRGGLDTNLGAFEAYDPATGAWRRLPDLPTRRGGLAAAATCAGHLVAVGGEEKTTFAEAEMYDIRAGTWRSLPSMPTPRHGLGVAARDTTVYTFAGGPRPGLHVADTTEAIDLARLGACPRATPM
jgi:hypothetical protein